MSLSNNFSPETLTGVNDKREVQVHCECTAQCQVYESKQRDSRLGLARGLLPVGLGNMFRDSGATYSIPGGHSQSTNPVVSDRLSSPAKAF